MSQVTFEIPEMSTLTLTNVRNYNIWDEAEAYTESAPKGIQNRFRSRSGEPFNILEEPDHLVVAASEREVIPYHEGIYTIYAQARSVVESWYLQIKVDGLEYVSSAKAAIAAAASRIDLFINFTFKRVNNTILIH